MEEIQQRISSFNQALTSFNQARVPTQSSQPPIAIQAPLSDVDLEDIDEDNLPDPAQL